ncbi:MAG: cation transporter [Acidobacteriota bacterium]|nr:heavy-metal-associated domain-containing protein [Acidobacteriota bacterium]MDQ3418094.1 cation transporter [Acidobacteriota bacterium]
MRKALVVMSLLTLLGFSASAQRDQPASGDVCTLKIKGMACSACAAQVEQTVLKLDGVKAAKVNQPKGTADITYDASKTTPAAIAKYITEKTGFKAEPEPPKSTPRAHRAR